MSYNNNRGLERLFSTYMMDDDSSEMIPLLSPEEEEQINNEETPETLPILAVRNTVLFPGVVIPITVGRTKSIKLVKKAYEGDKTIGVVAQENSKTEDPDVVDLYKIGTVAKILRMVVLPDGNTTIIIQGKRRFEILDTIQTTPYLMARIGVITEVLPDIKKKENQALLQSLKDSASKILTLNPEIPQEAQIALDNIDTPSFLTHFLSSNLNVEVKEKQKLLEIHDSIERATRLLEYMNKEIQMLQLKQEIQSKVHTDIDQQQRDFYLRQQIKVLQDELGSDGPEHEIKDLKVKAQEKKWTEAVAKHFFKELEKVGRMNPAAAEYPVTMNYLELMIDLPWNEFTEDNFDLKRAKKILDADHYGMEKIKDRILEYLAVLKLKMAVSKKSNTTMKAPILCLYGPPGVGKTSLGKSIAKALDRKYIRMSLGGVRDEAEIRGHRKTYVGAMPGRIIQSIKKVESSNPVFILDEIDKVGADFRGDPSSALLEVLDPEQNTTFADNYLEVDYDLSKVLFVATSNSLDTIQPALRDRMEIIELSGYTLEEKIEIAKKHLIPKQREEHGLDEVKLSFDRAAIAKIVEGYTRESGVRNLERKVGAIFRGLAKSVAMEEEIPEKITSEYVKEILGTEIFDKELYQGNETAGIVTGLAWTQFGGEILFIESSLNRGKGRLTLSGQLGDVMKESAQAALSYLKANADSIGIDHEIFEHYDLHVHVPAGAVPKDGPSAGITMLTSLASVYTQRKIKNKLAMTGEITLRGKVLPVGGIKEKILAAKRAGIQELIMCSKNRKDINEINDKYLKGLTINFVDTVDEVLEIALMKQKVSNPQKFIIPKKETK